MKCEQCTFLLELEADCLPTSFLDTHQSLPLNGINTPAKFCDNEQPMDGFQSFESWKVTCAASTRLNTPELWTAYMRDSLARILATPEIKQGLAQVREAVSTEKFLESQVLFDRVSSSWRMLLPSLPGLKTTSTLSVKTSLKSAITRNGCVYLLPTFGQITSAKGGGAWAEKWATPNTMDSLPPKSQMAVEREATKARPGRIKPANLRDQVSNMHLWPTPQARDFRSADKPNSTRSKRKAMHGWGINLNEAAKMWPTPSASDNRDRGCLSTPAIQRRIENGKQVMLSMCVPTVNGQLNPEWVEWLMGWPVGWTDTTGEEMPCVELSLDDWWATEPNIPRVADKIKNRVGRLKALGNGQVPLQAAVAFRLLEECKNESLYNSEDKK